MPQPSYSSICVGYATSALDEHVTLVFNIRPYFETSMASRRTSAWDMEGLRDIMIASQVDAARPSEHPVRRAVPTITCIWHVWIQGSFLLVISKHLTILRASSPSSPSGEGRVHAQLSDMLP